MEPYRSLTKIISGKSISFLHNNNNNMKRTNVEDDRSANAKSAETDHLIKQTFIESKCLQSKVAKLKERQTPINAGL